MRSGSVRLAAALTLALPAWLATPSAADRLPLATGDWIETRGPWRIVGETVVFTTPAGALRSLPLAELAPPDRPRPDPAPGRPRQILREDPWGGVPEIPDPGPLPEPPQPPLARPRLPPPLPVCILANAEPGEDPVLACDRDLGDLYRASSNGSEAGMVARDGIEPPTP